MALSYDEMQQLFEQIGFKGFSMRPYDAEMEYLLSEAAEYNGKRKIAEDLSPCGKMEVKRQGAERSCEKKSEYCGV